MESAVREAEFDPRDALEQSFRRGTRHSLPQQAGEDCIGVSDDPYRDLGAPLGSERVQFLDEHLINASVRGIIPPQLAPEINAPIVRGRPER
jgi:hypothetical protein